MSTSGKIGEVPFLAVGNDELGDELGATIPCQRCGGKHEITLGTGEDGKPSTLLQFYRCGDTTYLAGIGGRAVRSVP